jgi:uncharacterized membrane protein
MFTIPLKENTSMVPFVLLFVGLMVFRGLGVLGVSVFATWQLSAACALAVMFVFTAVSHFAPMKEDLIKMIPRGLPFPRQLVYLTGVLEILGALGLLLPATRAPAGYCLAALLIVMYPANFNAARHQIPLRGKKPTPFWLRLLMQLVYIGFAMWVAVSA